MNSGEFVFDMVDKLLETDVGLIIIDSVASLVPNYETDNEMDKQTIGVQARLMSKALRKINGKANKNKTLIIFINQIREKVGVMYGNPEITSGGRALAFYSSIRLEVKRGDFLKENESTVGHQVKFRVTKSKVCSPFKDGYFCFYYPDDSWTDGIKLFDDADELVSMLLINKKITRRGAWYDAGGESFQGREKLEEKIREDIKFKELLTKL
jgi:recombination protein RecA